MGLLAMRCLQPDLNPSSGQCGVHGCPCSQVPWSRLELNQATRAITATVKLPDSDVLETLEVGGLRSAAVLHLTCVARS